MAEHGWSCPIPEIVIFHAIFILTDVLELLFLLHMSGSWEQYLSAFLSSSQSMSELTSAPLWRHQCYVIQSTTPIQSRKISPDKTDVKSRKQMEFPSDEINPNKCRRNPNVPVFVVLRNCICRQFKIWGWSSKLWGNPSSPHPSSNSALILKSHKPTMSLGLNYWYLVYSDNLYLSIDSRLNTTTRVRN